jgi:hypothetical protein
MSYMQMGLQVFGGITYTTQRPYGCIYKGKCVINMHETSYNIGYININASNLLAPQTQGG